MGQMNQAFLATGTVKAFRGHAVVGGVVVVTDSELVAHLDATYAGVVICNIEFTPGEALQALAPIQFNAIKNDYQLELQGELQNQLANGNDVDIDFHD